MSRETDTASINAWRVKTALNPEICARQGCSAEGAYDGYCYARKVTYPFHVHTR